MRAFVLVFVLLLTSACSILPLPGSGRVEGTYEFVDLDGRRPPVESEPDVFLHAATVTLDETGAFTITMTESSGAPDAPRAEHTVTGSYTVDGQGIRLIVSGDGEEGVAIVSGTFARGELRLWNPDDPMIARFVRR